ncbi:MAG: hypothetical protein LBG16_02145, partial [Elusimicrobiota bacterium]|nr:hypothetical protein [Elusimicrobiota bacterium]
QHNNYKITEILLKKDADIYIRDKKGRSVLDYVNEFVNDDDLKVSFMFLLQNQHILNETKKQLKDARN